MSQIKSRFAPSPTGKLHVGNMRTAIITWLMTRSMGGAFLLRIDDTDQARSKDEYTESIKADMTWLGLEWDELAHQRGRFDRYNEVIERLKQDGRLYPCYETEEELALKRKSLLARGLPPIYDRVALELTDEQKAKYEEEGRQPHWRFKLNHAPIEWDDLVRGPVSFQGKDMADPVLIRGDGSPLYHLCSVIDDIDFGITHVVRGEDHVSNTAAHIQMFEAIGGKVPTFAHLPLLSDAEGGKLSKRLGSLSIEALREEEKLEPMALISLFARLGSSDPVLAQSDLQKVVENFDITRFGRGTPKFDVEELLRINTRLLHELPYASVKDRLAKDYGEEFWLTIRPNLEKLSDIETYAQLIYGPVSPEVEAEDEEYIAQAADNLPDAPWTEETWDVWTAKLKNLTGRKGKQLFMPLRKALTGQAHGPEMASLIPLIGREEALRRLESVKKAA